MQASLALGLVRHHDDELTSLKRLLGAFRFCLEEVFWTFLSGIFGAAGSPNDRGAAELSRACSNREERERERGKAGAGERMARGLVIG